MKYDNRTIAIVCVAIFVPVAILTSTLVGALLKLINPSAIDVWQPLAYLSPILLSGLFVAGLLLAITVVSLIKIRDTEKAFSRSARLPLVILLINCLVVVGIFAGQQITKVAEDTWARNNNQPTHEERDRQLDQFFKNLE